MIILQGFNLLLLIAKCKTGTYKYRKKYGLIDVIYLGYPNWWGTVPMVVFTFLESYDFSGKNNLPFCTHEGGGIGNSERDIKKLCPNAKVQSSLAIRGGSVNGAVGMVRGWVL